MSDHDMAMNYTDRPSGFCPDDMAREREANLPRSIDPDSTLTRAAWTPAGIAAYRAALQTLGLTAQQIELQCSECAVRVVGDVETDNYLCPLCEGEAT